MDLQKNVDIHVSMAFMQEPPRIIKKRTASVPGTKFATNVRIDVNQEVENISVQVYCLSYPQPSNIQPYACGPARKAEKKENYWYCEMKNLLFKEVPESEGHSKSNTDRVTDIRSWLLFQMKFPFHNHEEVKDFIFGPVIIVVHSTQEPAAQGTLWWHRNFFTSNYPGYEMKGSISTDSLMTAIKRYFMDILNPQHVHFIKERILGPVQHNGEITFKDFVHTSYRSGTRPTGSLKSWKWLYDTHHQLFENDCNISMWRLGLIVGFITKQESEEWLKDQPPGSFLLRFSESQPGSILVVVVLRSGEIQHWEPFTKQELESEDLKSRLMKYVPQILKRFHNKYEDALTCLLQVNKDQPQPLLSSMTPNGYTKRPDAGFTDGFNLDDLNIAQEMEVDHCHFP